MNDDLGDVGLNALEALEAQDQQEQNNSDPDTGEDEKDTSETGGQDTDTPEDTGEENNETDNDSEDAGEDGEGGDGSGEEEADEKADDEKSRSEDKELSDEEFEELAKKRGYSKDKSEDEKKAEESQKTQMEELMAKPDEIDEKVWNKLPDENKLIYNALPYITAEGKKGTIQIKTPEQLPADFEFKSQKAMMQFQNDLQAQELKATQMSNALAARAQREEQANAERAEAQKVISEIEGLQKSGALPTPKAKSGTPEFDNDPAVLLINKVLGYRAKRAEEGSILSVKDSLLIYKAEHPEEFKKKEAKGDIERRNIAKKVAGNSKATSSAVNGGDDDNKAHYYKPGMSTEDVLDAVLQDMD